MFRTLMVTAAALLTAFTPAARAASNMPHALSPLTVSVFVDVPDKGPLAQALTALVEGYGVVIAYGTDQQAEFRPDQVLTRGDLVQWLSAAADRAMMAAQELELEQGYQLPLLQPTMCNGNGWRQATEARAVAGYDAAAPWSAALVNLTERYSAYLVSADRQFVPAEPITVAQTQSCLTAFDPALRIAGQPGDSVTRGSFAVVLLRALQAHSLRVAALLEATDR